MAPALLSLNTEGIISRADAKDIVDMLLEAGADPDARWERRQPLAIHHAASESLEIVKMLTAAGTDIDAEAN